jgi:hypothetical protein
MSLFCTFSKRENWNFSYKNSPAAVIPATGLLIALCQADAFPTR